MQLCEKYISGKVLAFFSFVPLQNSGGPVFSRVSVQRNREIVPLQFCCFLCKMDHELPESEERIQSQCFQWAWNSYPNTRGLLCYNLNNSRNRIDGARNRALGLQPGRADMVLYWRASATFFEFKTPTGHQSAIQEQWQDKVQAHGFRYHIVRSVPEFQQLFTNVMRYG